MVKLKVKRSNYLEFTIETTLNQTVASTLAEIVSLYNQRQSLRFLCEEIEVLAQHGSQLPPDMVGLTDDQLEELGKVDDHPDPSGGSVSRPDERKERNGRAPNEKMQAVLKKAVEEVRIILSPVSFSSSSRKILRV